MIPCAAQDVDVTKPLRDQSKPDFVCEPGDPRVKKYGWQQSKFRGYLSIQDRTIWISSVFSLQKGKGHFSRMIRNIHKAGYQIKVPSPFPHMIEICKHLGFRETIEHFPEAGEDITVFVLDPKEPI
jgi:hypothetical protein